MSPVRKALNCGAIQQAARVAISCSYRIFNSRSSTIWDVVDLFTCSEAMYNCLVLYVVYFFGLARAPYFLVITW